MRVNPLPLSSEQKKNFNEQYRQKEGVFVLHSRCGITKYRGEHEPAVEKRFWWQSRIPFGHPFVQCTNVQNGGSWRVKCAWVHGYEGYDQEVTNHFWLSGALWGRTSIAQVTKATGRLLRVNHTEQRRREVFRLSFRRNSSEIDKRTIWQAK